MAYVRLDEIAIHNLKENLQRRTHTGAHTLTRSTTFQNVSSWLISEQICGYLKSDMIVLKLETS